MSEASSSTGSLTYFDAGVDVDNGTELVEAIKPIVKTTARPGADANIGGFAGAFDLKAIGYDDPVLLAATDGVGTKLKIAIATAIHDSIGIDLVAMVVNDLVVQGAEPLFFLDCFSSSKLERDIVIPALTGIAAGCREAGCAIIGGEMAELPGFYRDNDYDVVGFAVGAVERHRILPQTNIKAGDAIIGLASSGLHSNGFSLVRAIVDKEKLAWSDAAPFVSQQSTQQTLGRALLQPTRIYVRSILKALNSAELAIKAMAHITGGGHYENIPRVLPTGLGCTIRSEKLQPQPVMRWLASKARLNDKEMLATFNCGVGLVMITDAALADATIAFFADIDATLAPRVIGEVNSGGDIEFSGKLF